MARPSVIIKRERARKIALVARYAPALARRVERGELTPDKAIPISAVVAVPPLSPSLGAPADFPPVQTVAALRFS